ncbi:lytic transglycosylase domain-containing protein [Falsiroseomonas selenitidurans]|uniref:Lytic transglycosylase domain-containing protein n=1 Tax=Falsiroseomonas selenitidurans TaxID=2716335 RepID=A0ABX1E4P9_9PROT|nr:lytic transglycosylase domain-containing protein [Falsiroseomonas selenitidurans]NKC29905.1 lytic transglycosylase domain-containing protein [Falsiroseomonas selenitidurans]
MTRIARFILIPLLILLLPGPARAEPGLLCRAAIQAAEREAGLPQHLLMAIARVESGRRDPETGAFHPWPWTINAEGRGQFFPSRAAAIAGVQALQAGGMRSIDVGCMQVNLRHHPDAFPSLETAFDPLENARYAARFLTALHATRGDWAQAAGAYHSQTPERAGPYRDRVMAAWARERGQPHPPVALAALAPPPARPATPPLPPGLRGGALLSNGAEQAPVLAATPGTAGRGLDAYRRLPVPIAGRARGLVAARR